MPQKSVLISFQLWFADGAFQLCSVNYTQMWRLAVNNRYGFSLALLPFEGLGFTCIPKLNSRYPKQQIAIANLV